MTRISELEKRQLILEERLSRKKKEFKLPFKARRLAKLSMKKPNQVLVQYLTQKYQIKFMLKTIVSGNLIVVANKVHVLNPKKVWRYGKHIWYIIREIDRIPVSNEDYDEVKGRKDDTEADVPLIKAAVGAVQKQQIIADKKVWIIIAVIAAIVIIVFFLFGGMG